MSKSKNPRRTDPARAALAHFADRGVSGVYEIRTAAPAQGKEKVEVGVFGKPFIPEEDFAGEYLVPHVLDSMIDRFSEVVKVPLDLDGPIEYTTGAIPTLEVKTYRATSGQFAQRAAVRFFRIHLDSTEERPSTATVTFSFGVSQRLTMIVGEIFRHVDFGLADGTDFSGWPERLAIGKSEPLGPTQVLSVRQQDTDRPATAMTDPVVPEMEFGPPLPGVSTLERPPFAFIEHVE